MGRDHQSTRLSTRKLGTKTTTYVSFMRCGNVNTFAEVFDDGENYFAIVASIFAFIRSLIPLTYLHRWAPRGILLPTQKFIKGISSYDINYFLHTLSKEYEALGRNIQFTSLKVGRNKSREHRGFTGGSIEKLVLSRKGLHILFRRAKVNNSAHNAFICRLAQGPTEKRRFLMYYCFLCGDLLFSVRMTSRVNWFQQRCYREDY
jgi:hypothetical protein